MSDERTITASALADRLGGTLEGDGACVIQAMAAPARSGPDTIFWVGRREYLPPALASDAGVLLLSRDCALPEGVQRTTIRVADPDVAACEVLEFFHPPAHRVPAGVDRTATIGDGAVVEGAAIGARVFVGAGARIGKGTELQPGVYVGAETNIGRDCVLWPNVVVREGITIGDRVVIHPNTTIGADGFGYLQRDGKHRKIPQVGTVVIEDDVEIGANSAIDRARHGVTRIGRGTKIDNLVQIAHNCEVGEDCIIVAMCGLGGSARLGRHVVLGGQTAVADHRRVGDGVQVAAKSLISAHVPDGKVVRGIPATDNHRFGREQVSLRKLPEWLQRVRDLVKRVERLEGKGRSTGSTSDD